MGFTSLAGAVVGLAALVLAAILALFGRRRRVLLCRQHEELEARLRERERELDEARAEVERLERAMTDQQVAGGFGHEMRNALAGAKMLLGTALGPQGGQSLAAQDSEAMREALSLVRDRAPVSADRAGLVALLTNTKRNEQQIDEILQEVDAALARALAMTQMIMDYARLGREQP